MVRTVAAPRQLTPSPKVPAPRLRRLALAGYAGLSLVVAATVVAGVLSVVSAVQRTDQLAYQAAGRIVADGDGSHLYDPALQLDAERVIVGDAVHLTRGLPFNNPPSLAVLNAPLASLPQWMAFTVWTGIGIGAFAWEMWQVTGDGPHGRLALLALALSAWPVIAAALRGQVSLLVAGVIGASAALVTARPGASGVLLGIATLKPTLTPLYGFALFVHRPRVSLIAIGTVAVIVGLTIPFVGIGTWIEYPRYVLGQFNDPDAAGIHVEEMVNWRALGSWIGGTAGLVAAALGTAITLILTTWLWIRTRIASPLLSMAAVMAATPLLIPHANQHEALLAVPAWLIVVGSAFVPRWVPFVGITLHLVGWAALPLWGIGGSRLMFADWGSTPSGSRRSTPRRWLTSGMTSPITRTSTPSSDPSRTSTPCWLPRMTAGSAW